uniref:RING-type E3 ubiquitin transferase n=1 Tax=Accipiter nisus TaxID=211598 RepID=A0A8B9NCB4_9AVES
MDEGRWHVESMAAEPDNCCPICLDVLEEASFAMPCLHQFCYECILWRAESKPECPLCKRRIISVVHSVWADDDAEENIITPATASLDPCSLSASLPRAQRH